MTKARAAAYVGIGGMFIALMASAGSTPQDPAAPRTRSAEGVTGSSGSTSLATEVEAQAMRLRVRMAQAPAPGTLERNPFTFATRERPRPARTVRAAIVDEPAAAPPPAPMLSLIGVAEEPSPDGLHRTAMISGAGDSFYMVMEGQTFAGRYRVTAIGQDAVELKDLTTGAYRRLALR